MTTLRSDTLYHTSIFSNKDSDNPSVNNIKHITNKLQWWCSAPYDHMTRLMSTFTFTYLHDNIEASQSDGLYWNTVRNFTAYPLTLSVFLYYFKQNMKYHNRINVNLTLLISGLQTYIFLLSEIIIYKLYIFVSCYINSSTCFSGAYGGAVGWGTALQARRLPVRFPMVSLKFFVDIILPVTLWPWGWLSLPTEMSTRNISWG